MQRAGLPASSNRAAPAPARKLGKTMIGYYLHFRIRAEVAELLVLDHPARRLLVDVSVDPVDAGARSQPRPASRATLTITDAELIQRFVAELAPGDVVEASGTFCQTDYVPHRTTCIDTTFLVQDFRRIDRDAPRPTHHRVGPMRLEGGPTIH